MLSTADQGAPKQAHVAVVVATGSFPVFCEDRVGIATAGGASEGRPIVEAPDPKAMAEAIVADIAAAWERAA